MSGTLCVNRHTYKEKIDKLLKQKTEQQIFIKKLEQTNKMQMNINNSHEDIIKLKNDTEIAKYKMFSHENISQNKEMFKSTTGLEADDF